MDQQAMSDTSPTPSPASVEAETSAITTQTHTCQTPDGCTLTATEFPPESPSGRGVLITSALATPRRFYADLARWLAGRGITVVTFDYRGIGDSPPDPPPDFKCSITDWANEDIPTMVDFAGERPGVDDLYIIGHSMGGQLLGVLGDRYDIAAVATFCAQTGYWRRQAPGERLKTGVFMYGILPPVTRLLGYFPWGRIMGGEDIPRGVALQWARWCRDPNYLFGDDGLGNRSGFERFDAPILAYSFEDDPWGWQESVDWMMEQYTNAPVRRKHLDPAATDRESIGHFGFFAPDSEPLWTEMLEELEDLRGTD